VRLLGPRRGTVTRVLAGAASLALLTVQLIDSSAARAAGGTWGDGGYPYVAGKVCTTTDASGTTVTSPLAAWDLSGGGLAEAVPGTSLLGYLAAAPTSNGTSDLAAPPLAAVGSQIGSRVGAGLYGFTSDREIAVYARLISTPAPDDATAARIAQAVLTKTQGGGLTQVPTCGGSTSALLSSAASLAGPYTLTLAQPSAPIDPGSSGDVVATVLSSAGRPVPNVAVTYASAGGVAQTATTAANGTASLTVVVPTGTIASSVPLSASISLPIGLTQVTAVAVATSTNPSGATMPALIPSAPVAVTATANVAVSQGATPAVAARVDHTALTLGSPVTPQAVITGLHGHSANVGFTIYGPVALPANGTCAMATFTTRSPVAAGTTPVMVTGDQILTASQWVPIAKGCYLVHANLTTTNAMPPATAESSLTDPAATVAVIQAFATLNSPETVVGAGTQRAGVNVTGGDGRNGALSTSLVGPVAPADDGSCTGVTFTKAPTAATASGTVHGNATAMLKSTRISRAGCYLWKGTLGLTVGAGPNGVVQIPIIAPPNGILLLAPTVHLTLDRSSTTSPAPASATVTVTGLFNQAAHVALEMHYAAAGAEGCRQASWNSGGVAQTGPSTSLSGQDGVATVIASTGALRTLGCWYPVAVLTVDANPAITSRTAFNDPDAVISAGVDPNANRGASTGATHHDASWLPAIIAGGVVAGLELVLSVVVLLIARRSARRPARVSQQLTDELIGNSTD
jgi:hypothetical protein